LGSFIQKLISIVPDNFFPDLELFGGKNYPPEKGKEQISCLHVKLEK